MGFVQSVADPCLLIFHDERGVVYFVIYVDDCIIIVTMEDLMKQFKKDIGKAFNIKELGELWKYLGCFFEQSGNKIKVVQPDLVASFAEFFDIPTGPSGTAAVAGQVLLRGHDRLTMLMATFKRSLDWRNYMLRDDILSKVSRPKGVRLKASSKRESDKLK